jgi:hypothetical protein
MNLRLTLLGMFVPESVKTARIRELFELSATAFEVAVPNLSGLAYCELLKKYACFLKTESNKIHADARKETVVRDRLYKSAVKAGLRLKDELRIQSYDEALAASRIFYRIIGIDFSGDKNGNITIRKCFFSAFFSPENCRLVSALDEGVAAGLSGGVLTFTQRITGKKDCCRARMSFKQ